MERERLGSRLGFILLSAGCAIGCGNVWKFPWMVGHNGGGAFVLLYLVCLLLLGLPVMTMEFAIGRAAQASPVKMYQKLEKQGQKWHYHGIAALIGNISLMAFYTVVTGWMVYYFVQFLTGNTESLSFESMIAKPEVNVGYMAVTVLIGFFILSFSLQSGIEKITKYMMTLLLVLMVVLAVKSGTLENALDGYKFYLLPDFSEFKFEVLVAAMEQAFFTLSIGIGSMAIFGSYIDKGRSLLGESVNVLVLDTFVAFVSGLIIFPACATFNLEVTAGPALLFDTMATVFRNMAGGRIWGSIFFLFMIFAAFSTELAVFETILACVRELTGWSRKKGCLICGVGIFAISLTTAFGFSIWKMGIPALKIGSWLDFWDFIVSKNLLPLGALVLTLFCVTKRWGWGWDNMVAEANAGKGLKVKNWMRPVFTFLVPAAIIVIYVFQWL